MCRQIFNVNLCFWKLFSRAFWSFFIFGNKTNLFHSFPTFRCFYDNIFWGILFIWIFYFMSKSKNIAKILNSELILSMRKRTKSFQLSNDKMKKTLSEITREKETNLSWNQTWQRMESCQGKRTKSCKISNKKI